MKFAIFGAHLHKRSGLAGANLRSWGPVGANQDLISCLSATLGAVLGAVECELTWETEVESCLE